MCTYRPDKMINWSRVVLHTSISYARNFLLCSLSFETKPRHISQFLLSFCFLHRSRRSSLPSLILTIHLTSRFILTRFKIKSVQFEYFLFVRLFTFVGGLCNAMKLSKWTKWIVNMKNKRQKIITRNMIISEVKCLEKWCYLLRSIG